MYLYYNVFDSEKASKFVHHRSKNWSMNLRYSFSGWYNQSDRIYTNFKRTEKSKKKKKQRSKYIICIFFKYQSPILDILYTFACLFVYI